MHHHATNALVALSAFSTWCAGAHAAPSFSHVIIVVQENRTPDNLFGSNPSFEPGVDIATSGLDSKGRTVTLKATPINGCYDISHAHQAFTQMYNGGKMDGADLEQVTLTSNCVVPLEPQFRF